MYLAYNEHFTQSNIFSENVFPLFSVSHYSVLSLEILKEDWDRKHSFEPNGEREIFRGDIQHDSLILKKRVSCDVL